MLSNEEMVEIIGPCTDDEADCEIFRAAFTLQNAPIDNEQSQGMRVELAKVACLDCKRGYLADIKQ